MSDPTLVFASNTAPVLVRDQSPSPLVVQDATPQRVVVAGFKGDKGGAGPVGPVGPGIHVLGTYASLSALQTAHPTGSVGDAYAVAGDLYVWDGDTSAWSNAGSFQGPAGDPGQIRFTGHGAPGTIIGSSPSDVYLDLDTGNLYQLL